MNPIGIDLGTTYSAISKWETKSGSSDSRTYNLASQTSDVLASKVYLEKDGDDCSFLVGRTALQKGITNPDNAVSAVKRKMDDADYRYDLEGNQYGPIEISAEILKQLLKEVEAIEKPGGYLPDGLVVTVPYYFKQHQNLNTKKAVLKAISELYGSRRPDVERLFLGLVAEPIAAGLDFAFTNVGQNFSGQHFLIFDLGGGTFDITIFKLNQTGKNVEFEVLAIAGDDRLGGEDFDQVLAEEIWEEAGFDVDDLDEKSRRRVLTRAMPQVIEAKESLSNSKSTPFMLNSLASGMSEIDLTLRRADFETALAEGTTDYISKVEMLVDSALNKAGIRAKQINSVLLTGGSSAIPAFQTMLIDKFGENSIRQNKQMNLAVSRGAAIYAAYLQDEQLQKEGKPRKYLTHWDSVKVIEPTAHSIGIRTSRSPFFVVIKDNQITPASKTLPVVPSQLSADGKKVAWEEIVVLQGNKDSVVGKVRLTEELYTHGRDKSQIRGKLTVTAHRNLIRVKLIMPGCRHDRSDYTLEEDLKF